MTPPKKLTTRDLSNYRGRHRDLDMDRGVGLIPHGDRTRVVAESVIVEERLSVGKYDRYLGQGL